MDKLKINLENCYGIGKLEQEFDLERNNGCVIYAQNGTMKTSLANTFDDIANGREPRDRINPNRVTKYNIQKSDNLKLEAEEILVIKPYDDQVKFSKYKDTSLLVEENLRQEYMAAYDNIEKKKRTFLNKISKKADIKKSRY